MTNNPNDPETIPVTPAEKRAMYERHLAKANAAVAEGEGHLKKQRTIVAQLTADGRDVSEATALLNTLIETQAMHEEHRKTSLAEIDRLDEAPC
jgi:hypothetical protein